MLNTLYIFYALIAGLCVGSFLNVVVYRYPIMLMRSWKEECKELLNQEDNLDLKPAEYDKFNLAYPPSRCPHCETPIKPWQNIPVFSYLLLKGKCKHCGTGISKRYPLVELFTGLITAFTIYYFGANPTGVAAVFFGWCLITLLLIDLDHQLLLDNITLPLLWAGLIVNSYGLFTELQSALLGAVFGYLILWSVYWGFKLLTGKEGMGYGDFKLLAAMGAWLGWQYLPLMILLSSIVGAVIGGASLMLAKKGKETRIPFGPYLAIAGWISLFWGEALIQWYLAYAQIG